jgi:hypothetical protein
MLLRIISAIITYYYTYYCVIITYYYRNNDPIITYYYRNNEFIITVIMSSLLRIITRSIIRNNGFIITYYRLEQLGDECRTEERCCLRFHQK